jgi:ribonucleoside-triphosphate reductase
MNEACLNLLGVNLGSEEGTAFAHEVLEFMRDRLIKYQDETGTLYNLEATPAEGVTYRFAKEDQARYPGIIQAGTPDAPYYTNSTHLPVGYTDDPLSALDHQDALQTKYTGGTVLHLFLGERVRDWKTCASFVKKVAESYHLPYFTITPTFSICPKHGYLTGEIQTCPTCESTCEIWSRIVGYFRPVDQWNKGKKSEYKERKEYVVQAQTQNVIEQEPELACQTV